VENSTGGKRTLWRNEDLVIVIFCHFYESCKKLCPFFLTLATKVW
jgi:hypothetical protein